MNEYLEVSGQSEAGGQSLLSRVRALLCELAPDGTTLAVNAAATTITGYRPSDLIGRNWWATFFPGEHYLLIDEVLQQIRTGDVNDRELEVTSKDGSPRTLLWTSSNQYAPDGSLGSTLGISVDITRLKRREREVAETEQRFRGIFDDSPIALNLYDASGLLLDVNQAAIEMAGVPDVAGVRGFNLFDDPNVPDEAKDRLRRGETVRYEGTHDFEKIKEQGLYPTTKSGVMDLDVLLSPLGRKAGQPATGYLVQVQDITTRKRLEEKNVKLFLDQAARVEAESAARRISDILESIADGFVSIDRDWRYTFVNREAERLLHKSRAELIGANVWELFPENIDSSSFRELQRSMTGRITIDYQFFDPARKAWYENRAYPSADGLSIVFRDITERKRLEFEREQLLAQLDATFAAMPDGVLVYDAEGRIVRANPAALAILGFDLLDLQRPVADRIDALRIERPDGWRFHLNELPVVRALQGETVRDVVAVIHLRADVARRVQVSAAPTKSPDGAIVGAVAVLTDLTPQEQREDTLRVVSHDLRNPLMIIIGHSQVALRAIQSGKDVQRNIEAILVSAKRMQMLIMDLVDVVRVDAGELWLEKAPVDLSALLADLLERSKVTLDTGRITVQAASNLPSVLVDPERIERVFVNLLTNALKYSPRQTNILVRLEATNDRVVASVTDRGVGIAPEDLAHIFDRYFRATGTQKYQGIGMGLFIGRMLVEAHGGRIWAESIPGQGSTFSFSLSSILQ